MRSKAIRETGARICARRRVIMTGELNKGVLLGRGEDHGRAIGEVVEKHWAHCDGSMEGLNGEMEKRIVKLCDLL